MDLNNNLMRFDKHLTSLSQEFGHMGSCPAVNCARKEEKSKLRRSVAKLPKLLRWNLERLGLGIMLFQAV